jgi:titin
LKPSAPQQLTAVQATAGSTSVTLSWQTPANLGGATAVSYYLIDRSLDGGATWTQVTSSSATRVVIGGPAKGTSAQYRVTPRTGYGNGDSAVSAVVTSAATIPSTPTAVTAALSTDGSNTVTLSWMPPTDGGGAALVGYRIERNEVSSTGWSVIGTTDANTRTLQVPFSAPGSYAQYRVFAINQIGTSAQAYTISVRMPYAAPAASGTPVVTTAVNSTTTAPRILVTWGASTNFGGAGLSYYSLQTSTDGVTWAVMANTTATNWYAVKPATGTRVQYRVVVYTTAGFNATSGVTTVTH